MSNLRILAICAVLILFVGGFLGFRLGQYAGEHDIWIWKGSPSPSVHSRTDELRIPTSGAKIVPAADSSPLFTQKYVQRVHTVVPIRASQTQPVAEQIAPTRLSSGELTFDLGESKLTFDPKRPEHATVEHQVRCFVAYVTLELPRHVESKLTEARLFRIDCDAEAGSVVDQSAAVPNVTWEVRTLAPTKAAGKPAVAWDSSVGLGVSVGDWTDLDPAVTYSPLRLWRLRPAGMVDTGKRVGAGLQLRLWRPFHAGGFYTWTLPDFDETSTRLLLTGNF